MAIKFLSGIDLSGSLDLNKNELRNAVMHSLGTAPSNPVEGQMYWHSTDKKLYIYDATNTAWADVTGDITSVASGTGVSISGGSGGEATVSLSHLGLESLAAISSENADAIFMYDASGQAAAYLTLSTSTGISISSSNVLSLGSIPNASLTNSSITVAGGDGLTATAGATSLGGSTTIAVGEGTGIDVTADAVALKNHASLGSNTLLMWNDTAGQLTDTVITQDATTAVVTIDDDLVVTGDLTVQGSLTSLETTNTAITDNVIVLNSGEAGAGVTSVTSGIEIERGTAANVTFTWNETNSRFEVGGKLKIDTIATASSVATILVEEDVAGAGEVRKVTIGNLKTLMGLKNMSLSLAASSGTQASGALWVTKSSNTYTVNHQLGTKSLIAQVYDDSTGETVIVDVTRTTTNALTVAFGASVTDGAYNLNLQVMTAVSHGDGGGGAGATP
tara:strand:+ start:693 stop:2036 length:1344 start_codon:yes stop_codon:yes gene_type:complete